MMHKKSALTSYGIVTGSVIGLSLATALPSAAQRLPNRLHGPARIDSTPKVDQRTQIINRRAPTNSSPDAASSGGGVVRPPIENPAPSTAPNVALPTPKIQAPLPTKRASNAPVLNEQRDSSPTGPENPAPDSPADTEANPASPPRVTIERTPDENPETAQRAAERLAQLRKERFRRNAAESAQKEIEQMADQLREQLAREISARRKAEGVAAELVSRASLENQIDKERDRLRTEKIKALERRRTALELEVKTLTRRLADERSRRRQLEAEKATLAKTVAAARREPASGIDVDALKSRARDLERKLNAAEWARKLAEAQLRVMTGKADTKPSTASGQSN